VDLGSIPRAGTKRQEQTSGEVVVVEIRVGLLVLIIGMLFAFYVGTGFGAHEQRQADCARVLSVPIRRLHFSDTVCLAHGGKSRMRLSK